MPLRAAALLLAAGAGSALVWLLVTLVDARVTEPGGRTALVLAATLAGAAGGAAAALVARRSPRRAAELAVVAAAVLLAGVAVAALHGTRWGWSGLYSDASFRTQMATRYAETAALVDYGYRGLPAYYPPAVGWVQGRLAALTGLEGWEAVKPVQVVVGALVPVLAWALWRPVVGALPAAAAAGLVSVLTAHPDKPDEWLVLACLVPWWLLAVRDLRAPDVDRWPAWRLGLVLGALLLVHTYWFLPLGLATLLSVGWDALRRRRPPLLPWGRALAIGVVGLVVASPSWVPAVVARATLPSDSLQLRYSWVGGHLPPVPLPTGTTDLVGVAALLGLAWLVRAGWRWWRVREVDGLAAGLGTALAGALLTLALGAAAQAADVGFLAFKSRDLVTALLVTAGVLGGGRWLLRWRPVASRPLVPVALVAAVAAGAAHQTTSEWAGPSAVLAHTTRYPDGSWPAGAEAGGPQANVLFVEPDDPSVDQLVATWRELRPDLPLPETVLLTSQVDLLATTPVHGFVAYKSIYSHPNGQFEARVELLREVARCATSACAADLLRTNPFDRVDGLVLRRVDGDLVVPLMVDDFPHRTRFEAVRLPLRLFDGPAFTRRDVGDLTVVALLPGPDHEEGP